MSTSVLFRPTFADLRAEIERRAAEGAPAEQIGALVDQFLAMGGDDPIPWVEYDGAVTWLYRDADADRVAVVGDIVGYDTLKNRMERLPGSDLHYLTRQVPLDAQIEYVFALDDPPSQPGAARRGWLRRCKTDPLNRRQIVEIQPLRTFSVLAMPNARAGLELDGENMLNGGVVLHVVGSAALGDWRRVWVYLPPDYDPLMRRYPALYLNDGESYLLSAQAPETMDALIAQREIIPAILVFIQGTDDPDEEHPLGERFAHFLADELVPWIDERYATSTDPQERAVGGAAFGGTISLYAALERPEVFGRVVAQSPTAGDLIDPLPALLERNAGRGFGPPHCYIDGGRYESASSVQAIQALCDTLLAAGAVLSYQGFAGDRSFLSWRTTLPDALRFHFGTPLLPTEL
jgi:enterochelin esterase family protein